jgi:hypothetical protein
VKQKKRALLAVSLALFSIHLMRQPHTSQPPPTASPPSPPDRDPEAVCGPSWTGREWGLVWTRRREHVGLDYWFARFDRDGRAIGEPVEVGWGAAGDAECRLAWNGKRYALVFGFHDANDSDSELRLELLDGRGRKLTGRGVVGRKGMFYVPTLLVPHRDGWRIRYRLFADDPDEQEVVVDRDGW